MQCNSRMTIESGREEHAATRAGASPACGQKELKG